MSAGKSGRDSLRATDPDTTSRATDSSSAVGSSPDLASDHFATVPPTIGAATSQVTRFRILRPHARGGLGEVHVALDTELNREVALKEIQSRHADHPQSRARFTLEAEITGGLEHPGIVPVYGLGTYADGRPYYAMRFIRGDSLAEKIDRFHKQHAGNRDEGARTLELHKLLRRFIDVCEAIQYAHDRGVLHRDLKPGNIMLGKYGETLVVDWGLAKALGSPGPRATSVDPAATTLPDEPPLVPKSVSGATPTELGTAVGTPAYMSPEQAAGRLDELGPASDVYSLGATLYSLLTGRPPFTTGNQGAEKVLRRVIAADFPRPRQVSAGVPKALEAICLKAMSARPADRYATPAKLRDDLEHWLADEPVSARVDTPLDRAARVVRRHRGAALAAAAALLLVAVISTLFTVLINQQRKEAAEQSASALDTLAAVVSTMQADTDDAPAVRPIRLKLLAAAKTGLQKVPHNAQTARLQWFTHLELGNLYSVSGNAQAASEFDQALQIARSLVETDPDNPQANRDLAATYDKLGELSLRRGDAAAAKKQYEQALNITRGLADAESATSELQRDFAIAFGKLGKVALQIGDIANARKHNDESLEIIHRLAQADPKNIRLQRDLSAAYARLAEVALVMGQWQAIGVHEQQALEMGRRLADAEPMNPERKRELASLYHNFALARWQAHADEVKTYFNHALELRRNLAESNLNDAKSQHELSLTYERLGAYELASKSVDDAGKHVDEGLEITRKLAIADPENAELQHSLALLYRGAGSVREHSKQFDQALKHYELELEINNRLAISDPGNLQVQRQLAESYNSLGRVSAHLSRRYDQLKYFEKRLAITRRFATADPDNIEAQRNLADSLALVGEACSLLDRYDEMRPYVTEALQINRRMPPSERANVDAQFKLAWSLLIMAEAEMHAKRFAVEFELLTEALAILTRLSSDPRLKDLGWQARLDFSRKRLAESKKQITPQK